MEKSQYELCIEVLRRFDKAGILKPIVLVGSWCMLFYKNYFAASRYLPVIRTRDVDLLIPHPSTIKTKVDVAELLKELGFIVGFTGSKGYIRLEHPQLIVEFLVPERGRGSDKPYPLPQLGLNAQALRFLDFLIQHTITVKVDGMSINLPHPANFALHKLLIVGRRNIPEKTAKDKDAAIQILKALMNKGEQDFVRTVYNSMPQRWQTKVKKALTEFQERNVLSIFE